MQETAENDVIDETPVVEVEPLDEVSQIEGEQPPEAEAEPELVVSIGEEAPPPEEKPAPDWVRELRKNYRELQKQNKELEAKLHQDQAPKAPELGKKPTLEDYGWDAEQFEKGLASWYERKRELDDMQAKAKADLERQQSEWQARLEGYSKAKAELKVKDYEDAEDLVKESFNTVQQGVMIQGAENPALLVYALGKNPKKAKELASIHDPVKFAFAIAKLETQLKVTNRKAAPPPEKTVQGTGRISGTVDSTLDRLRADAEKTGDYSKVMAYKRQKK